MLSPFYEFIPHLTYPFSFLFSFFLPFFLSVSLLNLHMSPPLSTFLFTLVTALSQEDAQNCPKLWFSIAWPMTKLPECRVVTNNIISQIDLSSVKCYNKSTRKKKNNLDHPKFEFGLRSPSMASLFDKHGKHGYSCSWMRKGIETGHQMWRI